MLPAFPLSVPVEAELLELRSYLLNRWHVEFEPYPFAYNLGLVPNLWHFVFHSIQQSQRRSHVRLCLGKNVFAFIHHGDSPSPIVHRCETDTMTPVTIVATN